MPCPTCDAPQRLEREFSKPILRRRFPHGRLTCPHEGEAWHAQAERLQREIEATASPTLRGLLRRDLEVLLGGVLPLEARVRAQEASA